MPSSARELIALLRRGRVEMLQLDLDAPPPALAGALACTLRSLAPASLHACLLKGEPRQLVVVDGDGHVADLAQKRGRSDGETLAEALRAGQMTVVTRPIAHGVHQFGELGLA